MTLFVSFHFVSSVGSASFKLPIAAEIPRKIIKNENNNAGPTFFCIRKYNRLQCISFSHKDSAGGLVG